SVIQQSAVSLRQLFGAFTTPRVERVLVFLIEFGQLDRAVPSDRSRLTGLHNCRRCADSGAPFIDGERGRAVGVHVDAIETGTNDCRFAVRRVELDADLWIIETNGFDDG